MCTKFTLINPVYNVHPDKSYSNPPDINPLKKTEIQVGSLVLATFELWISRSTLDLDLLLICRLV